MRPETVKGDPKRRNVKDVADKYALAIEGDDRRTPAKDRSKGIVAHANMKIPKSLVRNEGGTVWNHVVRGTGVRYHHTQVARLLLGRNSN